MMYLALTYDHRLLDGREAVVFLVKVGFSLTHRPGPSTHLVLRSKNSSRTQDGCFSDKSSVAFVYLGCTVDMYMYEHSTWDKKRNARSLKAPIVSKVVNLLRWQ